MRAGRDTLIAGLLGITAALAACGPAMRPVKFEANAAGWQALAGEWRGEYWLNAYDRHGLIAFKLVASPEAASGDVLMISDRSAWPYQRHPPDSAPRPEHYDPTQLLTINFVRAEGGEVTGRLDSYWDPDRRCTAVASFHGSLDGDVIYGRVSSTCAGDPREVTGRWRATRKPAVPSRLRSPRDPATA